METAILPASHAASMCIYAMLQVAPLLAAHGADQHPRVVSGEKRACLTRQTGCRQLAPKVALAAAADPIFFSFAQCV